MKKEAPLAYLFLTLTALFWAGNAIAGRLAAGIVPPLGLTAIRWCLTVGVLFVIARPYLKDAMPLIRRRWRYLALMGAIGFAFFNMALYGALNFTTALNVAIEQSAMPVIILVAVWVLYRDPILPAQWFGAGLSVFGVLVTVSQGDFMRLATFQVNIGDAIMLAAVIAYSLYSAALKKRPQIPWQAFMFCLAVAAALFALPFGIAEALSGRLPAPDWRSFALIAYVTIFPSLFAQVLYLKGVEIIGAGRAGLFINLVPVFAGILAVTVLGETFQTYHAVGFGLVLTGIAIAEIAARRA